MNNISWSDKKIAKKTSENSIIITEKIDHSETYLKLLEDAYCLIEEEYLSNPDNRLNNAKIDLQRVLIGLN